MEQEEVPQKLFEQCRFGINKDGLDSDITQIVNIIQENGGTVCPDITKATMELQGVEIQDLTHIVSSTIDFEIYDRASDLLIPVVKPGWIDASLRKNKLTTPRQYSPDPRYYLSDVSATCADLPDGDIEAIIAIVIAMGGSYSRHLAKTTTHIVALNMDSEKCAKVQEKGLQAKIVLPHWFDDCMKLGKRLDEQPYLLPNPEILRNPPGPLRHVENRNVAGASTAEPSKIPTPATSPSADRRRLQVFLGKRVMLSADLGIGDHLRRKLEELIEEGGGSVTSSVSKAHMFICRWREGFEYKYASRNGSDVGNLAWLYHLITHNKWSSPYRKLLHYPVARTGLPGFKGFKISLSNYGGEARVYLENLIVAAGAEVTKTLRPYPENTHLITAHSTSKKVKAAREWGVEVVNHLWLEESYSKCAFQQLTNPKYVHFPKQTNLEEVVGQTGIDRTAMEKNFYAFDEYEDEVEDDESDDIDIGVTPAKQSKAMKPKDGNLFPGLMPPSSAAGTPRRSADVDKPTPKPSKSRQVNDLRTPSKLVSEGKENHTPGTGSSRKAKDVATAKIHDCAPDIALYEKEKKRVGGVIHGRVRIKELKEPKGLDRKRSLEDENTTSGADGREAKRSKTSKPPVLMHVMVTGYNRWSPNSGHNEIQDRNQLRELGIAFTTDAAKCTHLAAPQILRTHKFATALAYAPIIISTKFIDQCLERNELLKPNGFILRDPTSEKRLKISLPKALARAKTNANALLKDRTIYCVESIQTGTEVLEDIIRANGGRLIVYRGKPGTVLASRRDTAEDDESDTLHLISGTKKEQAKLWPRFKQFAEGQRWKAKIVKVDWLLDIAMTQQMRWRDDYELTEADIEGHQ